MTVLSNRVRAGGFIQSEANGHRSHAKVTLEGGTGGAGSLHAGTVLGKITSSGKYTICTLSASDGSQNPVAILFDDADATSADVIVGVINDDAEVRQDELTYDGSLTVTTVNAALYTNSRIKVRVRDDANAT